MLIEEDCRADKQPRAKRSGKDLRKVRGLDAKNTEEQKTLKHCENKEYKELQNNQYRESRDTLAVILDKLNVLENKIECLNQKSETIETDMRLVRNISQEQSRNLQGTNSGNVNELGDSSGAQVVTLNARGQQCGIVFLSLLVKIIEWS